MSLRAIIQHIATARGLVLEDPKPNDREAFMRFRVPVQRGTLDMDEQLLSIRRNDREIVVRLLDREVTDLQRTMFRATIDYIATHDREPLDRLAAVEVQARQLLDAIGSRVLDEGTPLGHAARELERLLRAKPGAASWQRDGYGKDPT